MQGSAVSGRGSFSRAVRQLLEDGAGDLLNLAKTGEIILKFTIEIERGGGVELGVLGS